MGYRKPHGHTGISGMIISLGDERDDHAEGFHCPRNAFVYIDELSVDDLVFVEFELDEDHDEVDEEMAFDGHLNFFASERHVDKLNDELVDEFIDDCWRLGLSWREVTTEAYVAAVVATDYDLIDNELDVTLCTQCGGSRHTRLDLMVRMKHAGSDIELRRERNRPLRRKGRNRQIWWKGFADRRREDIRFERTRIAETWSQDTPPVEDHLDALAAMDEELDTPYASIAA